MKLILPWPDAILSPNNSDDHRSKIDAVSSARGMAYIKVIEWKSLFPMLAEQIEDVHPKSVSLVILYFPPNNRRADWDNIVGRCKAYQDGIFQALGWDDKLITAAYVYKHPPVKDGKIDYEISWEE